MLEPKVKNWIAQAVGKLSKSEESLLEKTQLFLRENKTEDLKKSLFDDLHTRDKQRLLGITYTPKAIREEITKTVIEELLKSKKAHSLKICDPCCGSGTFSIRAIEHLSSIGIKRLDALENNIFFYDIDRLSVASAMLNIYEHLIRHKLDATSIQPNTKVRDFLESTEQFDAFITNPPYVKLQNLEVSTRDQLKILYPELFKGALGLSAIFLKRMFDNLCERGVVGVITQNNFFTSNSGVSLREVLQGHILKIDTFGSEPIFEGVTAYTCLMYLAKTTIKEFSFRKIVDLNGFSQKPSSIRNSSLNPSKWRLGSKRELEDLAILESKGTQLKQACRIWVGIATQFDKGFTVFKTGQKWFGTTPDGNEIEVEEAVVKPLIRVADLSSHSSVTKNTRGIIYPYVLVNDKPIVMEDSYLKKNFPKAYRFLSSWKEGLMSREKGRVKESDWYKWGRIQSMIPVKNKLLTKTFNRGPCFYFDKSDSLFSNGYALTPSNQRYDLRFIQSALNSKVFGYYAKLTSFEIEGEYQCYQKNFIERFCLPNIPIKEQLAVLKENKIDLFLTDYYGLHYKPSSA